MIEAVLEVLAQDTEMGPYLKIGAGRLPQFPHISIDQEERSRPQDDSGIERVFLKTSVWVSVRHYFEADRIAGKLENMIIGLSSLGAGRLIFIERTERDAGPDAALGAWRVQLTFQALIETKK
mgnify:CR=1 FL=1